MLVSSNKFILFKRSGEVSNGVNTLYLISEGHKEIYRYVIMDYMTCRIKYKEVNLILTITNMVNAVIYMKEKINYHEY